MTQARRTRQIVIGVVGLILLGACQKHMSLSDMQPLHQSEERITARLAEARREGRLRGAMVLATCNRFEILVDTDDDAQLSAAELRARRLELEAARQCGEERHHLRRRGTKGGACGRPCVGRRGGWPGARGKQRRIQRAAL